MKSQCYFEIIFRLNIISTIPSFSKFSTSWHIPYTCNQSHLLLRISPVFHSDQISKQSYKLHYFHFFQNKTKQNKHTKNRAYFRHFLYFVLEIYPENFTNSVQRDPLNSFFLYYHKIPLCGYSTICSIVNLFRLFPIFCNYKQCYSV